MNENLPQIQQKSDEMRQIYRRIDKLEVSASPVRRYLHAGNVCSLLSYRSIAAFVNVRCSRMVQSFVKMVGANVNVMEEHLTQAEGELGTIPSAFKKIFRTMSVPGFLNVSFAVCLCFLSGTADVVVWPSLLRC